MSQFAYLTMFGERPSFAQGAPQLGCRAMGRTKFGLDGRSLHSEGPPCHGVVVFEAKRGVT